MEPKKLAKIKNEIEKAIQEAIESAKNGSLATIGLKPKRPSTGYVS